MSFTPHETALTEYSSVFLQKLSRDHSDEDCFFDLLSKFQSSRMDDQRCELDEPTNGENTGGADADSLNDVIGQTMK